MPNIVDFYWDNRQRKALVPTISQLFMPQNPNDFYTQLLLFLQHEIEVDEQLTKKRLRLLLKLSKLPFDIIIHTITPFLEPLYKKVYRREKFYAEFCQKHHVDYCPRV
jgi:hypothetical protein